MSLQKTLLAAAALAISTSAHAVTFNLATALGSAPTFSITSSGVTATFTSPASTFSVVNTAGLIDFSPALLDMNPAFIGDNLTISFSTPLSGNVVIPFAILDAFGLNGPDTLTATASNGQSFSIGTTLSPRIPNEPEGLVNFITSSAITSVTLSSATEFAIGNVNVPEPMSLSLLGAGLVGLAASRRRAR